MKNKIIIAIIAIAVIIIAGVIIFMTANKENVTLTTSKENENNQEIKEENKMNNENTKYLTGKHNIEIEIKDYGVIALELDADVAPITVTNFINLTNQGFYNGLTFHRIIDGFMIQGGDPLGNGTGGSDENIKGEFTVNGVKNNISHVRGVISMARATSYNSASSQFFIVHEDSVFLDGQYAAFGKVTSGIEIVDKIAENTKVEDNNGTVLKENQPIINFIKVIE